MIIALVLMSITAVFMWNQKKNMWNIENNNKDWYLKKNKFSLKVKIHYIYYLYYVLL